jgi:solute carrier family 25 (mitochondrial uncoupling protein), member 8/9
VPSVTGSHSRRLLFMCAGSNRGIGIFGTISQVLRTDGLAGFMRGWSPSYARLGPHTIIMFLTAEQLRPLMGLKGL